MTTAPVGYFGLECQSKVVCAGSNIYKKVSAISKSDSQKVETHFNISAVKDEQKG